MTDLAYIALTVAFFLITSLVALATGAPSAQSVGRGARR